MRSIILYIAALQVAFLLVSLSCDRFQAEQFPNPSPSPSAVRPPLTPTLILLPDPTPTPIAGAEIIDGKSYFRQPLQGAVLRYEARITQETVAQLIMAYDLTHQLLQAKPLGKALPPMAIYLSTPSETIRFAEDRNFQHPAWLGGFYFFHVNDDGEVVDPEVFVTSTGGSISHTVGHELAHLATPLAPHWLSEGIAEYIGNKVAMIMEPRFAQERLLQTRSTLRRAIADSAALRFEDLEQFEWNSVEEQRSMELVYSQTWHLMEYLSEAYGPDALSKLLALYGRGLSPVADPFLLAFEISTDNLWDDFTNDISHKLLFPERVGQQLCRVHYLQERNRALYSEWNDFASTWISSGDMPLFPQQLQDFQKQWITLEEEAARQEWAGDSADVMAIFSAHFRAMVEAIDYFQEGEVRRGNESLAVANDAASQGTWYLNRALATRSWLVCSPKQ